MASLEVVNSIKDYAPKVFALASPWIYKLWSQARKRPMIWAMRENDVISVRTASIRPISKLALKISSKEAFSIDDIIIPTRDFMEGKVFQVTDTEVRVSFARFTKHDTLKIAHPKSVLLEVIESNAVPIHGLPGRYIALFDYLVAALAFAVFACLALEPVGDLLFGPTQQSQDASNIALKEAVYGVARGLAGITAVLLGAVLVIPGRIRVFLGREILAV